MNKKACFTNKTDDYKTPVEIYNIFISKGYEDICPYQSTVNYLLKEWNELVYCNPPYSQITIWVNEILKRFSIIDIHDLFLLIPARTDTIYFHKLMNSGYKIDLFFIKGRLKFNDLKTSAPFPSVLIRINRKEHIKNRLDTYFITQEELLRFLKNI